MNTTNTRNTLIALFTFLLFSIGNPAMADDIADVNTPAQISVNINADDAETLASNLTGIGITRAEAIVAYREAHGPFYSAEELSAVRGIGMTTVEKNAVRIVVD
jgi:competence protein ComEA